MMSAARNTTEEWPRENQKPTVSGRFPSDMNFRVVLSMAAMPNHQKVQDYLRKQPKEKEMLLLQ